MKYFIHVADPGYPDPPWPNQRRFGPYETQEEALNQAVSDGAQGMGVAVGIYSEDESDAHAHTEGVEGEVENPTPVYTQDQIQELSDKERDKRAELAKLQAEGQQSERDKALNALLEKSGITASDLRAAGYQVS